MEGREPYGRSKLKSKGTMRSPTQDLCIGHEVLKELVKDRVTWRGTPRKIAASFMRKQSPDMTLQDGIARELDLLWKEDHR